MSWLRPLETELAGAKTKAQAHFGAVSADNDGKFIVFPFKSAAAKQFVLSVIYRGKVTFHHVAPDEDDQLVINKKSYGEASTIQELVTLLSSGARGWPVQLVSDTESEPSSSAQPSAAAEEDADGDGPSVWYHTDCENKATAEERIIGDAGVPANGTFMVYNRPATNDQALCLIYRGKATHHLISTNGNGEYTMNKKAWGGCRSLQGIINFLQKPAQGWPERLATPVPPVQVQHAHADWNETKKGTKMARKASQKDQKKAEAAAEQESKREEEEAAQRGAMAAKRAAAKAAAEAEAQREADAREAATAKAAAAKAEQDRRESEQAAALQAKAAAPNAGAYNANGFKRPVAAPALVAAPSQKPSGAVQPATPAYSSMDQILKHHQSQQEEHALAASSVNEAAMLHQLEMQRYQEHMAGQFAIMQEQHAQQLNLQAKEHSALTKRMSSDLLADAETASVASTVRTRRSSKPKAGRSDAKSPEKRALRRKQKEAKTRLAQQEAELSGKLRPRKSLPLSPVVPAGVFIGAVESSSTVVPNVDGLYVTKGGHITNDGKFAYVARGGDTTA